jgi:hypothetical protein
LDSIAARNSNARCCPARVRRHPATQVLVRCLPTLPSTNDRIVRTQQYDREYNELWEVSVCR